MIDSRPPLPLPFRLLNSIARYLPADRLAVARLDEDLLHRAAVKETGLDDFGDPYYRDGLRVLIESAESDANLNFFGRVIVRAHILRSLTNRLLLAEELKQTPELLGQPLVPPLVVIGLPRRGTTLLHRLLAIDQAHRGIPAWELMYPLAAGFPDRRRQIVEKGFKFAARMNPHRNVIHPTGVDEPEECILLQMITFASGGFLAVAPVYTYSDWYLSQDPHKAYAEYRVLLQHLQMVHPQSRLALKTPAHTGRLTTLLDTIPDALVVQTHRDPVPCIPSACSLVYTAWGMVTDKIDMPRMVSTIVQGFEVAAAATLAFRRTNPGAVHDVYYGQLLADPVGVVRGVYERFGLAWPQAHEEKLAAYLREHGQHKYGVHRYSAEDFGLTDGVIAERFTEYRRAFGFAN